MNTPFLHRYPWLRTVMSLAVFFIAAIVLTFPLGKVYSPPALLTSSMWGALLGVIVAWLSARHRLSGLLTGISILALAYLGGVVLLGFGALAISYPVELSIFVDAAAGIVRVWKDMLTLEPRFGFESTMVLAPFLLSFVTAVFSGIIAIRVRSRRRATWAAAVVPASYVAGVLLGWRTAISPALIGLVLVLLLVVWAAWHVGDFQPRRVVSLLITLALMAGAAFALTDVTVKNSPRYVLRDEISPPFDPSQFPSPLSGYRKYIKDLKETELFTVSGLPAQAPIRLATMDAFDGVVWNVSSFDDAQGSGAFRRVGDQLTPTQNGQQHDVSVTVHNLPGPWVPTVGWMQQVSFSSSDGVNQRRDIRYNDATGTALLPQGLKRDTNYELQTVVPIVPDSDEIDDASIGSAQLPEAQNVPEAIVAAASDATREASSPGAIARAMEQYLIDEGWFSNGQVDSGDYPALAGHGAGRLISLLTGDLMVGNDEQYASAMALMGRSAGLPTRVVLGFIPEEAQELAENDEADGKILDDVTVVGDDVHAWVEVQFGSLGWVPFYPTPPESKTPTEDTPQDTHDSQPQIVQPPLPPPDPVTPPADDTEQPQTEDEPEEDGVPQSVKTALMIVGGIATPFVLWLVVLALIMGLKHWRRKQRREQGSPAERITGGWDEIVDSSIDANGSARVIRPGVTRMESAHDLAYLATGFLADAQSQGRVKPVVIEEILDIGTQPLPQSVLTLAVKADVAAFGAQTPQEEHVEEYWGHVDHFRQEMRKNVRTRRRRRSLRSLVSFRYRYRLRRAARKDGQS